jgi:hypothetical protein
LWWDTSKRAGGEKVDGQKKVGQKGKVRGRKNAGTKIRQSDWAEMSRSHSDCKIQKVRLGRNESNRRSHLDCKIQKKRKWQTMEEIPTFSLGVLSPTERESQKF